MATAPDPLPAGLVTVLTTSYLADTYLGGRPHEAGLGLGDCVRRTLATDLPSTSSKGVTG
ncbi:hypothetical protein OG588_37590 [Streptomyces prunicolor]|uniref:hypothetical protein n=1 Tax=Streptomyces prunicolor TaxID=67348 RepID=UPI00387000AA|nr:hypothetical protein OG588_37590 [Streptomyces prunicolor]